MRRTIAAFITALLITAAAGTQLIIHLAQANPIIPVQIPTPIGTKPPAITVFSIKNNSAYASNNIPLVFNVSITESNNTHRIGSIYCKVDWNDSLIYVYSQDVTVPANEQKWITEYFCDTLLTRVPEGNHNVSINVIATGGYYESGYYKSFYNNGDSLVNFIVDTTPPVVSSLSVENKTQVSSSVSLNFTVNEPTSQISYVVDGQENATVAGNTTLSGLSVGTHEVTVYAWDAAGNVGSSETVTFTVAEPETFPTVPVAAVSAVSIAAAAAAGLILARRKHRKEAQQT